MSRIKQELKRLRMGDNWNSREYRSKYSDKNELKINVGRREKYGIYDQGEKFTNII
jgi:hypothetical protein